MENQSNIMKRCFQLAENGIGKVEPNPYVGSVIVKNDKIIGEGWHEYFGGPHAEVNAFKNAVADVKGATLYCNLEPCCHINKKTPPCVPLLIQKGIAKVIISNIDPNPDVSGKGIEMLKNAGIEVILGVLKEEGEVLNRNFFSNFD